MLEVLHVSKTYRPKKGIPVRALDDVSLSFGDKGLVFILGKSGSGKSTLLNVVGGLDKADSGEFVIKGKSSKEFKTGDFDSYRNTFIGFIFQEYNILSEFNVGQNIALAMELQGKKATSEELNRILGEVDLEGYAGRKPSELSGGQKQRVAIARALIKEPEIIMADEPTGALDSNTGKQVFDTLKKLSKTKLVLVVSHDREFAEYYGDRVIELADGKVISDIVKYAAPAITHSEGISVVDGDILHIKEDYELTAKDLGFINAYLKEHKGETIISSDKRANDGLKRAAMMNESGSKESFRGTKDISDTELGIKEYDKQNTKFVRSRMPFRKAFKMGASGLKTKPIRLFFTILLSFVALAMFGLADTFSAYNKIENTVLSLKDSEIAIASFAKRSFNGKGVTESDIAKLKTDTGLDFKGVFLPTSGSYGEMRKPNLISSNMGNSQNSYYNAALGGFYEMSAAEMEKLGVTLVAGAMPTKDYQVAIPRYVYECYKKGGYIYEADGISIKKDELTADGGVNGIIGKKLSFSNDGFYKGIATVYTVTGIVDTKVPSKYDSIKAQEENDNGNYGNGMQDYMLMGRFNTMIDSGLHNLLIANTGYTARALTAIKNGQKYKGTVLQSSIPFSHDLGNMDKANYHLYHIVKQSDAPSKNIVWLDGAKETLADDESVFSVAMLEDTFGRSESILTAQPYGVTIYNGYGEIESVTVEISRAVAYNDVFRQGAAYLEASKGVPSGFLSAFRSEIDKKYQNQGQGVELQQFEKAFYADYLCRSFGLSKESGQYKNPYGDCGEKLYTQFLLNYLKEKEFLSGLIPPLQYDEVYNYDESGNYVRTFKTMNVVGFYADDFGFLQEMNKSSFSGIVSDAVYAEKAVEPSYFSMAMAQMPTEDGLRSLVEYHYGNMGEGGMVMSNDVTSSFDNVNGMIEMLSAVFLYVGLGLAAFSALLLSNFIAVSISNKRREIGILRAVGAKASDVFSIFFSESFLIAMMNLILGIIGTVCISSYLNGVFSAEIGISVLNFGIRQIALMFGISIGVAAIASFLPVYLTAKKRPIEAIRGR